MITQRLVTLYTHQNLFANRRLSYHPYPHVYSRLALVEIRLRVSAFAFQAEQLINFYAGQIVTEGQCDAVHHITSLFSMGPQFS